MSVYAKIVFPVALLLLACSCASETTLSDSQEYYVGRSATAKTLSQYKLYNPKNPDLVDYLTKIGYTIAFESDRPEIFKGYNFIVVEDGQFNACSFPSGFILITTGTIKHIAATGGGEDELAAIIAHEIAHVNKRHPEIAAQKTVAKQEGAKILSGLAGLGWEVYKATNPEKAKQSGLSDEDVKKLTGALEETVNFFGDVVNNGYGRDQELEADIFALELLARSGYDPGALKNVLAKLPEQGADVKGWLSSTHPKVSDRIVLIDKEIAAKKYTTGHRDPRRDFRFKQNASRVQ